MANILFQIEVSIIKKLIIDIKNTKQNLKIKQTITYTWSNAPLRNYLFKHLNYKTKIYRKKIIQV